MAEGLHLIDFEQLKIENQSLNEKIEERNEELAKLKKKTATRVQARHHNGTAALLGLHVAAFVNRSGARPVAITKQGRCVASG